MDECIKCGIKVKPPTFMVLYRAANKTKKKSMPVRHFGADSNCCAVASELKGKHLLKGISQTKIEKMLRILQELQKGAEKQQAIQAIEEEMRVKSKSLDKLSARELELQKQEVDELFSQNKIKLDEDKLSESSNVPEEISSGDESNDDAADEFWGSMP